MGAVEGIQNTKNFLLKIKTLFIFTFTIYKPTIMFTTRLSRLPRASERCFRKFSKYFVHTLIIQKKTTGNTTRLSRLPRTSERCFRKFSKLIVLPVVFFE